MSTERPSDTHQPTSLWAPAWTRPATPSAASSIVMEDLSSAGVVVLGEQGVLPVVTQNGVSLQNVTPNVFYLAGHLVDRLWQGILGLVLVFIVHLITQTKKRRTASTSSSSAIAAAGLLLGPQSLDNIYRCINRCIQCILSRPAESVSEKMFILEDFHKLTTNRYLSVRLFLHFIF